MFVRLAALLAITVSIFSITLSFASSVGDYCPTPDLKVKHGLNINKVEYLDIEREFAELHRNITLTDGQTFQIEQGVLWSLMNLIRSQSEPHNYRAGQSAAGVLWQAVLELGSGVGLPSMVAAHCNASVVIATDTVAVIESGLMQRNVQLNFDKIYPNLIVMTPLEIVDFAMEDRKFFSDGCFDVILGADVIYPGIAWHLSKALDALTRRQCKNTVVLLSGKTRVDADHRMLEETLPKLFAIKWLKYDHISNEFLIQLKAL